MHPRLNALIEQLEKFPPAFTKDTAVELRRLCNELDSRPITPFERRSILKVLNEVCDGFGVYRPPHNLPDSISEVCHGLRREAIDAINECKRFRDASLTWLRAMSLVLTMVSNASTHREKEARLRGCVEIIESAIQGLQQEQFELGRRHLDWNKLWISDAPTRDMRKRIFDLEAENSGLKAQIAKGVQELVERGKESNAQ